MRILGILIPKKVLQRAKWIASEFLDSSGEFCAELLERPGENDVRLEDVIVCEEAPCDHGDRENWYCRLKIETNCIN